MKNNFKKAITPLLFLLAFSPFLYYLKSIQSILLILTAFLLLTISNPKDFSFTKKNTPFIATFLVLTFYFLFYYSNKSLNLIGESFVLFIIPLFSYYLYQIEAFLKNKEKILFTYCLALSLLCLYFIVFYINSIPFHHFNWYLGRYNLEYYNKIHGTYICLWIGIAILFLQHYVSNQKNISIYQKTIYFIMFTVLILGLIIYNSRNIFIGLVFIIGIQFIILKKQKRTIGSKNIILVSTGILLVLFLSQRYLEDVSFLMNDSFANSTRYASWSCSVKLIRESYLLGGDYNLIQDKLDQCYQPFKNPELIKFKINSHSQYLDFLLKGGIVLLLSFLGTLFIKIKYAILYKDYLYLSITILFTISFVTENILIRQYGIYSYVLCDILFLGAIMGNKNHGVDKIEKS
jgi:O-antigen ligase